MGMLLMLACFQHNIAAKGLSQGDNTRVRQGNIPADDHLFRKSLDNYGICFSPQARWTDKSGPAYSSRGLLVNTCDLRSGDGEFAVRIVVPCLYTAADSAKEAYGKRSAQYKVFYDWDNPERYVTVPPTDLAMLSPDMRHRRDMAGDKPLNVEIYPEARAVKWFNADSLVVYTPTTASVAAPAGMDYAHTRVAMIQKRGRGYVRMECFFTEKAVGRIDKYIRRMGEVLSYDDGYTPVNGYAFVPPLDYAVIPQRELERRSVVVKCPEAYSRCVNDTISANDRKHKLSFRNIVDLVFHETWQSADGNVLAVVNYPGVGRLFEQSDTELLGLEHMPDRMKGKPAYVAPLSSYKELDTASAKEWFNADSALYLNDYDAAPQRFYLSGELENGDLRYSPIERHYPFCNVWLICKNGFKMRLYLFSKERLASLPEPIRGHIGFIE